MNETEVAREWLTNTDAERMTGLSRTTLWRLANQHHIKRVRVGRAVRIQRRSLEEFLQRKAEGV
jgi:excisionase family DNA binding protein